MNQGIFGKVKYFLLLFFVTLCVTSCGSGNNSTSTPVTPPSGPSVPTSMFTYSQIFSSTSPFHTTVAALKTNGATTQPQAAMTALWGEGVANQDLSATSYMFPIYPSASTDPVKTFICTHSWGGACNANNLQIHVPSGAVPEPQADAHIGIIDTTQNIEVDGWACTVTSTTVQCKSGGVYDYGGTGLEDVDSWAVHGGYAAGLFVITAQELQGGVIDHALGLNTNCLNNPTVYPADLVEIGENNTPGTDETCGTTGPPAYGDMIHLLWTPTQIAASSYSAECKTVLTALATYGAYTYDTGNGGLALLTQHQLSYTAIGATNPWKTTIIPDLQLAGDGSGTTWRSCLNRLSASDFELLQIKAGSY